MKREVVRDFHFMNISTFVDERTGKFVILLHLTLGKISDTPFLLLSNRFYGTEKSGLFVSTQGYFNVRVQ